MKVKYSFHKRKVNTTFSKFNTSQNKYLSDHKITSRHDEPFMCNNVTKMIVIRQPMM